VEFVDIAGLVRGASKGEGLGNQFLMHIRQLEAIVHVVRCFDDDNIIHVEHSVDPVRDISIIKAELALADLDVLERAVDRTKKASKGDKKLAVKADVLQALVDHVADGGSLKEILDKNPEYHDYIQEYQLITDKPVLYVANVAEEDILTGNAHVDAVRKIAEAEGARLIVLCGKMEAEIIELTEDEAAEYLADVGLERSGLEKLIMAGYELLGLITYFTAGEKEVRAWTIEKGTSAQKAAGKIHSDIERGFIRAEVVSYADFEELKSLQTAKEKGKMRLEGKEYIVQDGDIIYFRHNV
jgi:GTP-binding protein YchF